MKTFFVTGGAGFIGRAFCQAAELLGHNVFVYDSVNGDDVSHGTKLNDAMTRVKPDWVVHLAATPGVAGTMGAAVEQVAGMANVLTSTAFGECRKILFVSTGSVYGKRPYLPFCIHDPTSHQVGFYAAGKMACEGFLSAWTEKQQSTAVTLRLGTIIGPGNRKGLIFDFVRKLRQDPTQLQILGDGRQEKSYLHIEDLISAMFTTMEHADKEPGYHLHNVGNMQSSSVLDVAKIVAEELGAKPELKTENKPSGFFGDIPKIQLSNIPLTDLGWRPKHTPQEAVRANVRWLLENPGVFG